MGTRLQGECIQPEGTESQIGVQSCGAAGDGNGRDHVRPCLGPAGGLANGNRFQRFFEIRFGLTLIAFSDILVNTTNFILLAASEKDIAVCWRSVARAPEDST